MTTAGDIISRAFREANFNAQAVSPGATENSEGLALLQSIVDGFFGQLLGTRLTPWPVPVPQATAPKLANYPAAPGQAVSSRQERDVLYPPANARLLMRNENDVTLYFQYAPDDGAIMEYVDLDHGGDVTIDANGALFKLTGTNSDEEISAYDGGGRNTPRRWVYRGDYGSWLEVLPLALTTDMPFPSAFDDYFVTALAIRLSPRFGSEPRQVTVMRYQQMEQFIRAQWRQSEPALAKDLGVPAQQSYGDITARGDFLSGAPF